MNKELTPLEAFRNIFNYLAEDTKREYKADLKIIKTALKRLEEIDNRPFINGIREEIPADIICKKLKALEIIKRTGLSVDWFVGSFIKQDANYNVFLMLLEEMGNEGHLAKQLMMTKKEFDLLKEVLK